MKRFSKIAAITIVSESEIAKVFSEYDSKIEQENPELLKQILFQFGMDTSQNFERQDGLTHRNMFNEVVICSRWVGQTRLDDDWINSGFASKEAIDKWQGSKIVESLYREKCLTEDAQAALEQKDAREARDKKSK